MDQIDEREWLQLMPKLLLEVKVADKQMLLVIVYLLGQPTENFDKEIHIQV